MALQTLTYPLPEAAQLAGMKAQHLRDLIASDIIRPTRRGRVGRGGAHRFDVRATMALLIARDRWGRFVRRQDLLAEAYREYCAMPWGEAAGWLGLENPDPWDEEAVAARMAEVLPAEWAEYMVRKQDFLRRLIRLGNEVRARLKAKPPKAPPRTKAK
jgi:hypothetical protein